MPRRGHRQQEQLCSRQGSQPGSGWTSSSGGTGMAQIGAPARGTRWPRRLRTGGMAPGGCWLGQGCIPTAAQEVPLLLPVPITHSAPSWPALPGEQRPGQAQEPQVSCCPGSHPVQATLLQEPSTLSPTLGALSLHTHTSFSSRSGAWPALPSPDQGVSPPERSLSTWKCTPDGKEGHPDDSQQKCGDFVQREVSIFPGFHWSP